MARSSSTIGVFNDLFLGPESYAHSDINWVGDTANPGTANPDTVLYNTGDLVQHNGSLWIARDNATLNDNIEPTVANAAFWLELTSDQTGDVTQAEFDDLQRQVEANSRKRLQDLNEFPDVASTYTVGTQALGLDAFSTFHWFEFLNFITIIGQDNAPQALTPGLWVGKVDVSQTTAATRGWIGRVTFAENRTAGGDQQFHYGIQVLPSGTYNIGGNDVELDSPAFLTANTNANGQVGTRTQGAAVSPIDNFTVTEAVAGLVNYDPAGGGTTTLTPIIDGTLVDNGLLRIPSENAVFDAITAAATPNATNTYQLPVADDTVIRRGDIVVLGTASSTIDTRRIYMFLGDGDDAFTLTAGATTLDGTERREFQELSTSIPAWEANVAYWGNAVVRESNFIYIPANVAGVAGSATFVEANWTRIGGARAFTGLSDTPATLGSVGQVVAVNAAGTALEFVDSVGIARLEAATNFPIAVDDIVADRQYTLSIDSIDTTGNITGVNLDVSADVLLTNITIVPGVNNYTFSINQTDLTQLIQNIGAGSNVVTRLVDGGSIVNPDGITFPITVSHNFAGFGNSILIEEDGVNEGIANTLNFVGADITIDPDNTGTKNITITQQEQNLISGTSSFPTEDLSSVNALTVYSLEIFNRTGANIILDQQGSRASTSAFFTIVIGDTVIIPNTLAFNNVLSTTGLTTGTRYVIRTTTSTDWSAVGGPNPASVGDVFTSTVTVTATELLVLGSVSFDLTVAVNGVTDRFGFELSVANITAINAEIARGFSHTDNLYVVFNNQRYPIVHSDEDRVNLLQNEIDTNTHSIETNAGDIQALSNRVDSIFYANDIAHYEDTGYFSVGVSTQTPDVVNDIAGSTSNIQQGGNDRNGRAYPARDLVYTKNDRAIVDGSRLGDGTNTKTEIFFQFDNVINKRFRNNANVSFYRSGLPLFALLYERRFVNPRYWAEIENTGTQPTATYPLSASATFPTVDPVTYDVTEPRAETRFNVQVYNATTGALVPNITFAQLLANDMMELEFSLPNGLYWVVYEPDFSVPTTGADRGNYVPSDQNTVRYLTGMDVRWNETNFANNHQIRSELGTQLGYGWQLRYLPKSDITIQGVSQVIVAMNDGVDQVGVAGTAEGFRPLETASGAGFTTVEGIFAPNGELRIFDTNTHLNAIERFLANTTAGDIVRIGYQNRLTDGTLVETNALVDLTVSAPGITGTVDNPIPGLARRQVNAQVSQPDNAGPPEQRIGAVRNVNFIDLAISQTPDIRNFADPGSTISLLEETTAGLLSNPFIGAVIDGNPTAGQVVKFVENRTGDDGQFNGFDLAWADDDDRASDPRDTSFELFFGFETLNDGNEVGDLQRDRYDHGVYGTWYWFPNRTNTLDVAGTNRTFTGAWSQNVDFVSGTNKFTLGGFVIT